LILRSGILGGTFDPVHNAHLALARLALAELGLEKILWMPTGATAYRRPAVASAEDRVAMLRLALEGELHGSLRHAIDERELQPGASGYTYDSVSALRRENPGRAFVLLMGSDQYEKRATWHRWPELEKLCEIAVAARPGSRVDAPVRLLPMSPSPVSASEIRARVARGEAIASMVPPSVADYIRDRGLYR
jgi:nicotinate-nucleotide adenylyltransferase